MVVRRRKTEHQLAMNRPASRPVHDGPRRLPTRVRAARSSPGLAWVNRFSRPKHSSLKAAAIDRTACGLSLSLFFVTKIWHL